MEEKQNNDSETKPKVKIGLEIHVPLKTKQKLFCSCPTNYYEVEEPNTNICPVCTGMPGSKPYPLNQHALETVVMIAKLLNCSIPATKTYVKRKHYDYPDLPSGYQRTSEPIGVKGNLEGVGIWEVHLEEDPGRYDLQTGRVDYNRSGCPLIEIVTAPEMYSPEDARNFLKELLNLLKYTGRVVEAGGVMRADVNISLDGGQRVEIKNINSIKGAYKAISYEIIRQTNLIKRGGIVKQETRGFNEKTLITTALRIKETAEDYRYIPDPDIPPLHLQQKFIESINLPETPQTRRERLIKTYNIPKEYAQTLVKNKELADLFEEITSNTDPQIAADWICREVIRQLNYRSIELEETKLNKKILTELLNLIKNKEITDTTGKKLLERIIDTGESPKEIVVKESLTKISETKELSAAIDEAIKENQKAVADYRAGKKEALNYLIGQVMKKMRGRADSNTVNKLLTEKLS